MAKLLSDSQGFLVGKPQDIEELKGVWQGIYRDVKAIRDALLKDGGVGGALARRSAVRANKSSHHAGIVSPSRPNAANDSVKKENVKVLAGEVKKAFSQPPSKPQNRQIASEEFAQKIAKSTNTQIRLMQQKKDSAITLNGSAKQRDSSGRFIGKNGEKGSKNGGGETKFHSRIIGAVSGGAARIKDAASELAPSDDLDPTIRAYHEISQPLSRGARALFGGLSMGAMNPEEKRRVRWYNRFFSFFKKSKTQEEKDTKAMRKSLKNIEQKEAAGATGGGAGFFGGLLGGGGVKAALMGLGAGLGGLWKVLKGFSGGLLKRIPLIGGVLTAVGGFLEYMGLSGDMSQSERDKKTGGIVGKVGGAIGGGLTGAAMGAAIGSVVPVVGTVIGGIIGGAAGLFFGEKAGEILGETVGGWVTSLRNMDIGGKIVQGWESAKTAMAGAWDSIATKARDTFNLMGDVWDKVTEPISKVGDWFKESFNNLFNSIAQAVKDVLGIDIAAGINKAKEIAQTATAAVKDGVSSAISKVSEVASKAGGAIKEKATSAADLAMGAASSASNYLMNDTLLGKGATFMANKLLGKGKDAQYWEGGARHDISSAANTAGVDAGLLAKIAHFESGFNANAAPIASQAQRNKVRQHDGRMAISSAHGYGQFIDGTWMDMVNKYGGKYGVQGAGKLNKAQANALRGDKALQAAMLAEFTKENIAKGRKLGGADDDANVYAFHNLGDGDATRILKSLKDNPNMSVRDALIGGRNVSAQELARIDSVISGNPALYGNGKISVNEAYGRMGSVMRRADVFAQDARAYAANLQASPTALAQAAPVPAAAVGVNVPIASATNPAKAGAAAVAPATPHAAAVASSAGGRESSAQLVMQEPMQDLQDRKLAHIATGGLST